MSKIRSVEIRFETKRYLPQEKGFEPQFVIFALFPERTDPSSQYRTGK